METSFYEQIISNIIKIMRDRNLTQAIIADYAGISASQFSKVISGKVNLSFLQLSKIATKLSMSEMDIVTYPDHFYKKELTEADPVEAVLQIKLKKDKKDQVLKLVFGDNNIEILNK